MGATSEHLLGEDDSIKSIIGTEQIFSVIYPTNARRRSKTRFDSNTRICYTLRGKTDIFASAGSIGGLA